MNPILIQGAEYLEINYLKSLLDETKIIEIGSYKFSQGKIENYPIIISETKIGLINSSIATTIAALNFNPSIIINQGTAGSHSKQIHKGDIVLGEDYIQLTNFRIGSRKEGEGSDISGWKLVKDDDVARADNKLIKIAKSLESEYKIGKVHIGRIGSGDIWNREADRILFLNKKYGTLCEEMETAGVYEVAKKFNIPVLGIRIVSNNEILGEEYEEGIATICQEFVEKVLRNIIERIVSESNLE